MNVPVASFLAMVAGWVTPLLLLAFFQLRANGRTTDIASSAFWVGLFTVIAWAAIVLPVMLRFKRAKIFNDLRFSWLGWTLLALGSYSVLGMVLLFPFGGWTFFIAAWYPALMGFVAGIAFPLLRWNFFVKKET